MRVFSIFLLGFLLQFFSSCSGSSGQREKNRQLIEKLKPLNNSSNVVKILDGDTYDILIDGIQTRIRMEGIDAPERGMDYYKVSKDYLGELCFNQLVRIEGTEKDKYGRLLAKTYLEDGREVGEAMVKAGMAWHFKKYSNDEKLAQLENEARVSRVGLWSLDNPVPPWEYRKSKKKKN